MIQQLDQTGGPIQHFKRIGRDLIRHSYRIGGKLSKVRIAQAVELALALSFTPATCSWATTRVGWGEEADGGLVYEPISRPWIVSQLVDDIPPTDSTIQPQPAADPPSLPVNSSAAALALFRSGGMDGEAGIAAGRQAALAILGRGAGAKDGWDNEADMEDGVIEEEGSRSRRASLPNGRIVARREFRTSKAAQGTSASDAAAAELIKLFCLQEATGCASYALRERDR